VSVSLAWTLVGGQCALCPDTQATQASQHDCCKHAGQHDSRDSHDKRCPAHGAAFESYGKTEIEQPAAGQTVLPALTLDETAAALIPDDIAAYRHPPPERHLLNSVLLI
jgi:hypothetical protein